MRSPLFLLAAALALPLAPTATAQEAARPEVAVVVVPLDDARHGQVKHGRSVIAILGHERFGRYRLIEPTIPLDDLRSCEEDTPEYGLAYCARFYLHRALTPESPPHVVVAFADQRRAPSGRRGGDMRALCFGPGAGPADPEAQDIWLWTDSARVHGVRDWDRDREALAACIEAALSETPGEPKPDPL